MKMNHSAKRVFLVLAALLLTALFTVGVFAEAEDAAPADAAAAEEIADETAADDGAKPGINVTFDRLPENLCRMGVGMLCIIIVMGVLIGVTLILNKVTAPKDTNK